MIQGKDFSVIMLNLLIQKKNVILPEESITFVFSFYSTIIGTFCEDWELICEPSLIEPLPLVHFVGHSLVDDGGQRGMGKVFNNMDQLELEKMAHEILQDILDEVKSLPPPPPDLSDPEVAKQIFENLNSDKKCWYSTVVIHFFYDLLNDINEVREIYSLEKIEEWDHSIKTLQNFILELPDSDQIPLLRRLDVFVRLSQWRPFERSPLYDALRSILEFIVDEIPPHGRTIRKNDDMWEYIFRTPGELTEEEEAKKKAEENKLREASLKKKKKTTGFCFYSEEEEKAFIKEYNDKFNARMEVVITNKLIGFDQLVPWYNLEYYMEIRKPMRVEYFEHIIRKFPLKSMEIEGKRVIIRYNIKLDFGSDGLLKKEAFDMYIERELTRKQELARFLALREHSKKAMTKKEKREEQRLQEPEKPDLSFIEAKNYLDFMETIRYCIEHLAKLVILVVSFDKPLGGFNKYASLEFLYEHLKQVMDCPVNFNDQFYIEDYMEVLDSDAFPENSILLLENVNFEPGEVGIFNDSQRNQKKIEFEVLRYNPGNC